MSRASRHNLSRAVSLSLMMLSYGCLTYGLYSGLWMPLAGSASICFLAWLAWPDDWRSWTGLELTPRAVGGSLLLFLVCFAFSALLVSEAASLAAVERVSAGQHLLWRPELFYHLGQTLNEEIILGAVLLNVLVRRVREMRRLSISLSVAGVFTLLHLAFYSCRPDTAFNEGTLSISALAAIFGGGVLRNNLILASGHIGYSWAIHSALNVVLFAGYRTGAGTNLNDPELFNTLLGRPVNLAVIGMAVLASLVLGRRRLFVRCTDTHQSLRG